MSRFLPECARRVLPAVLLVVTLLGAADVHAQSYGLYASAFLDSTRTPSTRITVDVPFRTLVFLKKEGYYDARFEAYISILETGVKGARPTTYVLNGFATVKTYEETKKRDQKARAFRDIQLPPGQYVIESLLRIRNTDIALHRSVTLRVPDFLASGMGFGTPVVLSVPSTYRKRFAPWAAVADSLGTKDAAADASIVGFERQPAVRFAMYLKGSPAAPVPCDVYYEVVDAADHQLVYGRHQVELKGRDDEYVVAFRADEWSPGIYKVNLRARAHDPDRDATASVDVRIDVTRAMLGANFNETLEILGLIASKDELKELREAPESERAKAWAKFWAARDPDPSTVENEALTQYIARVQYVAKEYSQFGPGWRSDRGRVYIRYGAPDQIDTAMDQRSQGEYEIWRYYTLNRTFVFYDMFGVGDFKLVEGEL